MTKKPGTGNFPRLNSLQYPHMPDPAGQSDPSFRPPSRREHAIAASLFLGFAAFFVLYSFVWRGSWLRWGILAMALWSALYALLHLSKLRHQGD